MTDQQLMLLEQLAYIEDAYNLAGVEYTGMDDVSDVINVFFTDGQPNDILKKLWGKNEPKSDGSPTGSELAAVIQAIQSDEELMGLKLADSAEEEGIYCFTDPNRGEPGEAIVVFQGTTGGYEWLDNFLGLNMSDTKSQEAALRYINGLDYSDITVVGHSKGGNKAQYVSVLSDKVNRCISMDGQGFSQEFLDKYWAEIQAKGSIIKNYSLTNDYVHILMFPVPGSEQIYCYGDSEEFSLGAHRPDSYFTFYVDENGRPWMVYDPHAQIDGTIRVAEKEDELMTYLRQFVYFIMNTMPDDQKTKVAQYLGTILALSRDGNFKTDPINGVVYTSKDLIQYIFSDPGTASLVISYLAKYIMAYDLSGDEIMALFRAFGLGDFTEDLKNKLEEKCGSFFADLAIGSGDNILKYILMLMVNPIVSPAMNLILAGILKILSDILSSDYGVDVDLNELTRNIAKDYAEIGPVDIDEAVQPPKPRRGRVYNYSEAAHNVLTETIRKMETMVFDNVAEWRNYEGEDWYGPISVGLAVEVVNKYYSRLSDINKNCQSQIDRIFSDISVIDRKHSNGISEITEEIKKTTMSVKVLTEALG